MTHCCRALILHCMDFRLGPAIKKFMEEHGLLGDADIVSVAGAAKNLDLSLGQIELSVKLHSIKTVILMNHTDCGAYGGRSAFASEEDERQAHIKDMETAKQEVLAHFPNLEVQLWLAVIDERDQVKIERV